MPVSIKNTLMQYKKSDGNYVNVDAISDNSKIVYASCTGIITNPDKPTEGSYNRRQINVNVPENYVAEIDHYIIITFPAIEYYVPQQLYAVHFNYLGNNTDSDVRVSGLGDLSVLNSESAIFDEGSSYLFRYSADSTWKIIGYRSEVQFHRIINNLETDLAAEVDRATGAEASLTTEVAGKLNKPSGNGTAGQILRTDGAGGTTWENAATAEEISSAANTWLGQNITNPSNPPLDRSLSLENAAAPADMVGNLESDLHRVETSFSKIADSNVENVDLDISDSSGNVILRLENGNIHTVNFNSEHIPDVKESIRDNADLNISDENGNVLVRFAEGDIRTSNFDSAKLRGVEKVYSINGSNGEIFIVNGDFHRGDTVVFAIEDGLEPYALGNVVSYYEGEKLVVDHIQGSNMLYKHIITEDCDYIKMDYQGGSFTPSETITFSVYKLGTLPIVPQVVTVKKDGSGMFTTIRAAVDYVNAQNPSEELNPFIIEVHPGVYNVFDDYTMEEIIDGNDGTQGYTQSSFVGIKLIDGVSMCGVGQRESIILHGELDPSQYNKTIRNNISTLNLRGSNTIKNLTITSNYLRYVVHDDFWSPYAKHDIHQVINCKFIGKNFPNTSNTAYGGGVSWHKSCYFKNCDFFPAVGMHLSRSRAMIYPMIFEFENCSGLTANVSDAGDKSQIYHTFVFNDCDFQRINIRGFESGMTTQHSLVYGRGNQNTMFFTREFDKYSVGSVREYPLGLTKGQVVDITGLPTTDPASAYGICIGSDNHVSYVQFCGYINNTILGINLVAGDYITIDSNGMVVAGGTNETSIGKCEFVIDGVGQIKLNTKGRI